MLSGAKHDNQIHVSDWGGFPVYPGLGSGLLKSQIYPALCRFEDRVHAVQSNRPRHAVPLPFKRHVSIRHQSRITSSSSLITQHS